jgi:hypothetical protein
MKIGTLTLNPNKAIPDDTGGIVTSTFGISEEDGQPFFVESVQGWFTPDGSTTPEKVQVNFWLSGSGRPSTLGGLVRADEDGWPLASKPPRPSGKDGAGPHQHQVLAKAYRAVVRCSLELAPPRKKQVPAANAIPQYEAYSWQVSAPVDFDVRPGSATIRASEGAARPPRVAADTEVDGI